MLWFLRQMVDSLLLHWSVVGECLLGGVEVNPTRQGRIQPQHLAAKSHRGKNPRTNRETQGPTRRLRPTLQCANQPVPTHPMDCTHKPRSCQQRTYQVLLPRRTRHHHRPIELSCTCEPTPAQGRVPHSEETARDQANPEPTNAS